MNKLTSFKQISAYRPKPLSAQSHGLLVNKLKFFKLSSDYTYLKAKYQFPSNMYNTVVDKMTIIGQFADTIDHHPQWTLTETQLQIGLSTHQCQGKVSIKDYILATWIQSVWSEKPLQQRLISEWNKNQFKISQIN